MYITFMLAQSDYIKRRTQCINKWNRWIRHCSLGENIKKNIISCNSWIWTSLPCYDGFGLYLESDFVINTASCKAYYPLRIMFNSAEKIIILLLLPRMCSNLWLITASASVLKSWLSEFEEFMTKLGFSSRTFWIPEKENSVEALICL